MEVSLLVDDVIVMDVDLSDEQAIIAEVNHIS